MRGLILLGAAAVGASVMLSREPGRRWLRQAGESMRGGYDTLRQRMGRKDKLERWVEETANRVHPDTTMSHAFEDAVHAG
jgi:hypothetical protein